MGTAGSTQFSSEDIRKAIYEFRGELKGNILGLIHSHHNLGMGSKFSSIDIDTLVENASNFPTPFFSLIVHNTQPYTVKYSMKINGQIYVFKGVVKFEEKKEIFDTSFLNKVNSLEEQQNKYCVPVNRESGLFVEKSTGSLFNSEPYSYNPIERKYYDSYNSIERKYYEPKIFKK